MHRHHPKSLRLKILPLSPYKSEILMRTRLQLHCFHRPGGRGGGGRFGLRMPEPNRRVALVYGRISGSVATSDGDERYLLECGVVAFLIGFSFAGPYLLDGGL